MQNFISLSPSIMTPFLKIQLFLFAFSLTPCYLSAQGCTKFDQLMKEAKAAYAAPTYNFDLATSKLEAARKDCPSRSKSVDIQLKKVTRQKTIKASREKRDAQKAEQIRKREEKRRQQIEERKAKAETKRIAQEKKLAEAAARLERATTIYELYPTLPKGGCALKEKISGENFMDESVEEVLDYPREDSKVESEVLKKLSAELPQKFQAAARVNPLDKILVTKKLQNGDFCFYQNKKWGIKNAKGNILLKPTFDHIIVEKNQEGVIGYQNGKCNYYLQEKSQFKNDYYFIKTINAERKMVQTKNGFGIIDAQEKILLQPQYQNIEILNPGKDFLYKAFTDVGEGVIITQDFKTQVPFDDFNSGAKIIDENFLWVNHEIIDLRNQRKLLCSNKYEVYVKSKKHHLATISRRYENENHWMDFVGNLKFKGLKVQSIDDAGNAIAARRETPKQFGIINLQEKWLVEPNYTSLKNVNATLYIATDATGKFGVIDVNNKIIFPLEYESISLIKTGADGTPSLELRKGKEYITTIVSAKDLSVLKKDLPYAYLSSIGSYEPCVTKLYRAKDERGSTYLDENFETIMPQSYSRIFHGGGLFAAKKSKDKNNIYDCDGKLMKFQVNGNEVNEIAEYKKFNDNLTYVKLSTGEGYFINAQNQAVLDEVKYYHMFSYSAGSNGWVRVSSYNQKAFGYLVGLVDANGNKLIEPKFHKIDAFDDRYQMAQVAIDKKTFGVLTEQGEIKFVENFDSKKSLGFDLYLVEKNKKRGIVNHKNEIVIPLVHAPFEVFLKGGIIHASGEKYDMNGKVIR